MLIVYTGQFDEVEVPYTDDEVRKLLIARRGEPVECPAELAASLLEQSEAWRPAESPARGGRKTEATTPAE